MTTQQNTRSILDQYGAINGARIRYRRYGEGSGPLVLVVHGIMGHAREWETLVDRMTPPFQVVTFDQRGHGMSDRADEYSIEMLGRDMLALLDHLEAPSASVVAHSLGGMALMWAAAHSPERFDRLVFVDVAPDSVVSDAAAELPGWIAGLGATTYSSMDEAVATWLEGDPFAREDLIRHYVEHCLIRNETGALQWIFDADGLSRLTDGGIDRVELWKAVDAIDRPSLLVRGEHSPLLGRRDAERMVDRLADAHWVEIPDGAHDLGVEQPESVADAALAFLA